MGFWNRGRTEDLGGGWPQRKVEARENGAGKLWDKWRKSLKKALKFPEYITENVSEELIRLEDLVKVYDTGAL